MLSLQSRVTADQNSSRHIFRLQKKKRKKYICRCVDGAAGFRRTLSRGVMLCMRHVASSSCSRGDCCHGASGSKEQNNNKIAREIQIEKMCVKRATLAAVCNS
jgi:hypothetical protein